MAAHAKTKVKVHKSQSIKQKAGNGGNATAGSGGSGGSGGSSGSVAVNNAGAGPGAPAFVCPAGVLICVGPGGSPIGSGAGGGGGAGGAGGAAAGGAGGANTNGGSNTDATVNSGNSAAAG
jgi:hypothetical protein